ncbi:hypothetical protein ACOKW7_02650 [Limnospira platensis CENA597]
MILIISASTSLNKSKSEDSLGNFQTIISTAQISEDSTNTWKMHQV